MVFSYSGLRTQQKVTLPSNDNWGTNINILKDPPKSLYVPRKEKVGDNVMLDNSSIDDRINESISVYPKGVNPFVSVSYSNMSNNGGHLSGSSSGNQTNFNSGLKSDSKLPYKVFDNGAFRPEFQRYEEKFALSRQPVDLSGYDYTTPIYNPNTIVKMGNNEKFKQIIPETFKVENVQPNARFRLRHNIQLDNKAYPERFTKDINNQSYNTDKRKLESFELINRDALNKIKNNVPIPLNINKSGNGVNGVNQIFTEKYTKNVLKGNIPSNLKYSTGYKNSNVIDTKFKIKAPPTISYTADINKSNMGRNNTERFTRNPANYKNKINKYNFTAQKISNLGKNLDNLRESYISHNTNKNIPKYKYNSQKTSQLESFNNNYSRNYKIKRERNYGGFTNGGVRNSLHRGELY